MQFTYRSAAAIAAACVLAGCAGLSTQRVDAETRTLVETRLGIAPAKRIANTLENPQPIDVDPASTQALTADDAIRIAFMHNPRIQTAYARLGIGRADLDEASRLSNPTFRYSTLTPRGGAGQHIARSLSVEFTELLLLPARKRYAAVDLQRIQFTVATDLMALASDVEIAWFKSVGAHQVAAMRNAVARSTQVSADLAQGFFDAGNINRLQLEQERAANSQARIDAARADVVAMQARNDLARLLGLRSNAGWTTLTKLPAPVAVSFDADALSTQAIEQRLDLAAASRSMTMREDAVGVARRWRWLGAVEFGYSSEHEIDGSNQRGPTLALSLPIFNRGKGAILRSQSALAGARAELDALTRSVHDDVHLGLERVRVAYDIVERYRTALLPSREAIVSRSQEQLNFMLIGVFELIAAKQNEYAAYQAYLEAVRDYWIARAELKHQVGGRLPDDGVETDSRPDIGVEAILPSASSPADADPQMQHHSGDTR